MGCNDRLTNLCESAGIDSFILTFPFGRGVWVPPGLYHELDDNYEILGQRAFLQQIKEKQMLIKFRTESSTSTTSERCRSILDVLQ